MPDHSHTPPPPTEDAQEALNARFAELAAHYHLLPIKVSAFYRQKIDAEVAALGHRGGPLHRGAYPPPERLALHTGQEVADWVDDRRNMPHGAHAAIIHKYPDRVLFMPTPLCVGHCQYCFRQDVLHEHQAAGRPRLAEALDALHAYLRTKPEVREVILSGGDPLALPKRDLALILSSLRALPQLTSLRIHTRALAFQPRLFTDPERLELLARADVRLVFHFIHPYEICAEVEAALSCLRERALRLYNHFPLLRGINDHVDVLQSLIEKLDRLHVRTLSIYVPEPVRYSAPYRLALKRIFALQDALTERTPSWINALRFTLDTPIGKVRREHIRRWDEDKNIVTFVREGKEILYPDFPSTLDRPGDRDSLLWRERG